MGEKENCTYLMPGGESEKEMKMVRVPAAKVEKSYLRCRHDVISGALTLAL